MSNTKKGLILVQSWENFEGFFFINYLLVGSIFFFTIGLLNLENLTLSRGRKHKTTCIYIYIPYGYAKRSKKLILTTNPYWT